MLWPFGSQEAGEAGAVSVVATELLGELSSSLVVQQGEGRIYATALDAGGRRLALAVVTGAGSEARVFDLDDRPRLLTSYSHPRRIRALGLDPAGRKLAMGDEAGALLIWDLDGGPPLEVTEPATATHAHRSVVNWVTFARLGTVVASPADGQKLATASRDGTCKLWRVGQGATEWVRTLRHDPDHGVSSVVFDRSGERLLTAGGDGDARRWRVADGALLGEPLHHHRGALLAAVFLEPTASLATAGSDGIVRVWNAETGVLLHQLAPAARVNALATLDHGRVLVSADQAGKLRLWDTRGGRPSEEIEVHQGPIYGLATSEVGDRVLTGGEDGRAVLWLLSPGEG